ncbi:MAG: universal stress protein [Methanosarcinales archaeon]|nr:universal stress protein [ANME-2 cluster archaeon]MDF1531251.1 universal stress protein [ANME-2 cluster archaeon]MDW7776109.1 universal stress protein [Methanosarcinales archaeon]
MKSEIFKKIVIATDGSENSANAIKHAIELARISEASLSAVYVVDTGAFVSIPVDMAMGNMYEILKTEGDNAVKQVEDLAQAAGIETERFTIEGHPAEEIIKFSENISADLIVMGTLGKSGLDRFLLGSVAEKVSRNSQTPVMVVRGENPK